MSSNTPYTYLIGWKDHNAWYYGVRYSKHCNPNDLWTSYFTSSKHVKEFRLKHGEPDVIEVRKVFDNRESAQLWETKVLQRMNVIGDSRFLNKAIGKSLQDFENRKKIMIDKYGVENSSQLPGIADKISNSLKGKKKSEKHKQNLKKPKSKQGKLAIKMARINAIEKDPKKFSEIASKSGKKCKGSVWWNNGETSIKSRTCPGNEWKKGRIKTWNSSAPKGHKKETVICPHCNKIGGKPVMIRYHFDNCKIKQHSNKGYLYAG